MSVTSARYLPSEASSHLHGILARRCDNYFESALRKGLFHDALNELVVFNDQDDGDVFHAQLASLQPKDSRGSGGAAAPDERRDRGKVNEAVCEGLRLGPLRSAGSAGLHGVPKATE
jgi:hypothetical protein